jgi:hypothetical protein
MSISCTFIAKANSTFIWLARQLRQSFLPHSVAQICFGDVDALFLRLFHLACNVTCTDSLTLDVLLWDIRSCPSMNHYVHQRRLRGQLINH